MHSSDYRPAVCRPSRLGTGSRETPYGRVRTRWQRTAEGIRLYVELPVGVTATLRLPEGLERCTVDGRRISRKARTTELVQGTTRIEMYMR